MRKIVLAMILVFLSGCSANLTKRPPYSAYIHQPRVLVRPVLLCRIRDNLSPSLMTFDRKVPGQYLMIDIGNAVKDFYEEEVCGGAFREASPGARVAIGKVHSYCGGSGFDIQAYGSVQLDGQPVPFLYDWPFRHESRYHWYGGEATYYLLRAPWDDESVPAERDVGFMGKEYHPTAP